ncbi:MAG: DUF998 domain-containing protein [Candidatus Eremiobacteraeota bacterium]|nr:DUF998 domain-containing protein [Candidatus Eremiobacteraeota bacterium]
MRDFHVLSPEFDPSWRVVSEYADGRYAWVLTLMFALCAFGTWALAYAVWPYATRRPGRAPSQSWALRIGCTSSYAAFGRLLRRESRCF